MFQNGSPPPGVLLFGAMSASEKRLATIEPESQCKNLAMKLQDPESEISFVSEPTFKLCLRLLQDLVLVSGPRSQCVTNPKSEKDAKCPFLANTVFRFGV